MRVEGFLAAWAKDSKCGGWLAFKVLILFLKAVHA
jgi:hypothetical protein